MKQIRCCHFLGPQVEEWVQQLQTAIVAQDEVHADLQCLFDQSDEKESVYQEETCEMTANLNLDKATLLIDIYIS